MNIIDLSHAIHPDIPVYPGTETAVITTANTIAQAGFAEILDRHDRTHGAIHLAR